MSGYRDVPDNITGGCIPWRKDVENAPRDGSPVLVYERGSTTAVVAFWGCPVGGRINPVDDATWCVSGSSHAALDENGTWHLVFNHATEFGDEDIVAWAELVLPDWGRGDEDDEGPIDEPEGKR